MRKISFNIILTMIINLCIFSAYADETTYKQSSESDGSTVMEYSGADGTTIKETKRSDGTIETHAKDAAGNEAGTVIAPDGNITTNSN